MAVASGVSRNTPMDGVLVVDKPQGPTSHDVVATARRRLREPRIGHTGTLDPLATGVLPLVCGRATRLVRFLTASSKDYEATIRFGLTTDSHDIMGRPTGASGATPTREALEACVRTARGRHLQVPPAISAKKVQGERAYARARRDEPVALEPVEVTLAHAEVLRFDGATAVVTMTCSAGFYVRSFARDLGERLGTGACLAALRRTRSGEFDLAFAITLEELEGDPDRARGRLVPLDRLLPSLPSVRLTDEGRLRIAHGRTVDAVHVIESKPDEPPVRDAGGARAEGWTRLLGPDGTLLALGQPGATHGSLHPSVVLI